MMFLHYKENSMQNRKKIFERELHELLLKDSISLETNIINRLIYKMAGITVNKDDSRRGLVLFDEDDKKFSFTLPNITIQDFIKLTQFFGISYEMCQKDSPLVLEIDYVLKTLLPNIKKYYSELSAEELNPYQIESKPILEAWQAPCLLDT